MKKTDNIIKVFEAPKADASLLPTAVSKKKKLVWIYQSAIISALRVPKCHQSNKPLPKPLLKTCLVLQTAFLHVTFSYRTEADFR